MAIIWNGLLSKAVILQEEHGTKDLRFFGVSFGWIGFGFIVGLEKATPPLKDVIIVSAFSEFTLPSNRINESLCNCSKPRGGHYYLCKSINKDDQ